MSTTDEMNIDAQRASALAALEAAGDHDAIEQWYRAWIAPSGAITRMKKGIGQLPAA